jgi:hypothetical protein
MEKGMTVLKNPWGNNTRGVPEQQIRRMESGNYETPNR